MPENDGEPKEPWLSRAGTLGTRAWDFISRLASLTHEQARHSKQLDRLAAQMVDLSKDVHTIKGKLEGIEKRLEEKDAHVKTLIELEVTKLRAELTKGK